MPRSRRAVIAVGRGDRRALPARRAAAEGAQLGPARRRAAVGLGGRHGARVHGPLDDRAARGPSRPDRVHRHLRPADRPRHDRPARLRSRPGWSKLRREGRHVITAEGAIGSARQPGDRSFLPRAGAAAGRVRRPHGLVAGADPGAGADLPHLRFDLGHLRLPVLPRRAASTPTTRSRLRPSSSASARSFSGWRWAAG